MKTVFGASGEKKNRWAAAPALVGLLFFLLAAVGIYALNSRSGPEAVQLLQKNLRQAAVECYAVEGRYPESIEYLERNYRIHIDRDKYVVYYENQGENLVPEITVIELK